MNVQIAEMGRQALDGQLLDRDQLLSLSERAAEESHELLYWANRVRTKHFSNSVRLCSVAATRVGGCGEDCHWCAQAAVTPSGRAKPRLLETADVVDAARQATKLGVTCFGLVNSGKGPGKGDFERTLEAIQAVREDDRCGLNVSASLGVLSDDQAASLAEAGIFRYHHNLETSRGMFGRLARRSS